MKRNVKIGVSPTDSKKSAVNSRLRSSAQRPSQSDEDMWREELSTSRTVLVDKSEKFSRSFYEAFESRIIA